jgi:NADH:ubiquinone oxidoreductase subunit E
MRPVSWNEDAARRLIAAHAGTEGALLPILHDMQHAFGHVPDEAVRLIAPMSMAWSASIPISAKPPPAATG